MGDTTVPSGVYNGSCKGILVGVGSGEVFSFSVCLICDLFLTFFLFVLSLIRGLSIRSESSDELFPLSESGSTL